MIFDNNNKIKCSLEKIFPLSITPYSRGKIELIEIFGEYIQSTVTYFLTNTKFRRNTNIMDAKPENQSFIEIILD